MDNIVVFNNSQRKLKIDNNIKEYIVKALDKALENEGISKPCEISVTFVSDKRIRTINKEFRNIDRATDVLSFPFGEDGDYDINPENDCLLLGDVVISAERALEQSDTFGHSFEREMVYLSVHSILHLLGYDHVDDEEQAKIMRRKEEAVMTALGLVR